MTVCDNYRGMAVGGAYFNGVALRCLISAKITAFTLLARPGAGMASVPGTIYIYHLAFHSSVVPLALGLSGCGGRKGTHAKSICRMTIDIINQKHLAFLNGAYRLHGCILDDLNASYADVRSPGQAE